MLKLTTLLVIKMGDVYKRQKYDNLNIPSFYLKVDTYDESMEVIEILGKAFHKMCIRDRNPPAYAPEVRYGRGLRGTLAARPCLMLTERCTHFHSPSLGSPLFIAGSFFAARRPLEFTSHSQKSSCPFSPTGRGHYRFPPAAFVSRSLNE